MTRSPLAYPLNRSADSDVGGAADLQTDIMRFMAILSLCLVAIFALVQSIPLTPVDSPSPPVEATRPGSSPETTAAPASEIVEAPQPPPAAKPAPAARDARQPVDEAIVLTRPRWVPKHEPKVAAEELAATPPPAESPQPSAEAAAPVEEVGFTLRFESDAALTRAVAASHVGLYAIEPNRSQRMTVSNSRISFWEASTPNTFHEMETATVPAAVIDALERTGTRVDAVNWGVTLPGKMKTQLDALMQAHSGGFLIIGAGGDVRWEAS